jgi:hypothetical protein
VEVTRSGSYPTEGFGNSGKNLRVVLPFEAERGEREREKRKWRKVVIETDTTCNGGKPKFSPMQFPRQCPLVLFCKRRLKKKARRSEVEKVKR